MIILVSIINPWMILIVIICAILMILSVKKGSHVMIEAQKRELEVRSPITDTFSLASVGVISLRCYEKN